MISKEEVKKVAKLARLGLAEKEIGKFQQELSSILDYVKKLKKADVSKIEPTSHPNKAENVMRADDGHSCSAETKKSMIEQAPEEKDGYVQVKQIL